MLAGRQAVGHPVDIASGTVFTARHDLELMGSLTLVWRAYYSTAYLQRPPSIMGPGWVHPFASFLRQDLDGYTIIGPEGEAMTLDDPDGVVASGGLLRSLSEHVELRYHEGIYEALHWHAGEDDVLKFQYRSRQGESIAQLVAMENLSGNRLEVDYDHRGRIVQVKQVLERRAALLEYDEDDLISRLYLAAPQLKHPRLVATYQYDQLRRLQAVIDADDHAVEYEYDDRNRLVRETAHTIGTFVMEYDDEGRCIRTAGEDGHRSVRLRYSPLERTTRVTDSLGSVTKYRFNEVGQVVEIAHPNGGIERTEFDEFGRVAARIDPLGRRTALTYDDRGDRVTETGPGDRVTELEYNSLHLTTRLTDPMGATTTFEYDERGNEVRMIDALGRVTQYVRSEQGVLRRIIKPSGVVVELDVDPDWTEITIGDAYGTQRQQLDPWLNVVQTIDAKSHRTRFERDAQGRIVRIVRPDGGTEMFDRAPGGAIVSYTDPTGRRWNYELSPYGEVVNSTDPLGQSAQMRYDTEGRLVQLRDPRGQLCAFAYDSVGNLTEKTFFDGRVERYEYDLAGQLTRRHLSDGTVVSFAYDATGNRIREAYPDDDVVEMSYNPCDDLTRVTSAGVEVAFEYDAVGNLAAETQRERRVEYGYDGDNNLATRRFQGTRAGTVRLDFAAGGDLRVGANGQQLQTWHYDENGRLASRRMQGAVEEVAFDANGREVEQRWLARAGASLFTRRYAYDPADRLVSATDSRRGETRYTYDLAERLASTVHDTATSTSYRYDESGNLLFRSDGGTLTYGPGNQCLGIDGVTYAYDACGRLAASTRGGLTTRYVWDAKSLLTAVQHPDGTKSEYGYDGLGRRLWKHHAGRTTQFVWADKELIAEECEGTVKEFLALDDHLAAIWINGKAYDVATSRTPLPLALLDARGDIAWSGSYDDWGRLTEASEFSLTPPVRFPGQYFDAETGFHYSLFRYYNPVAGQFISPDALGIVGGLNDFVYAPDPVNWYDPFGLKCKAVGCRDAKRRVRDKVRRMRENMSEGDLRFTAYSAAEVITRSGRREIWVAAAGREGLVPPRVRGRARVVHMPPAQGGRRVYDAERHILRTAAAEGATVTAIGATRNTCRHCAPAIRRAGYGPAMVTPVVGE